MAKQRNNGPQAGLITAGSSAQQARRSTGPLTGKGHARKAELLRAARRVFEDIGFLDARVADIVAEANVAQGTFYTYFDSKDAVFRAVAAEAIDEMLEALRVPIHAGDPYTRVHDALDRYVATYREHARIIGLIEQAATITSELREMRLALREGFVQRSERGFARMQDEGVVEPGLNLRLTAELLGAMVDHTCYIWFTLGKEFDEEELLDAMTKTWTGALGIRRPTVDATASDDPDTGRAPAGS
ncbi:MAG: TetR family transcriptional regulator [Pseudonocardiaceae bacterium]|nr:TetR family transcriptional regulator [Pseudonocardiaceae bacterium]